jgi:hypothetical protein
MKILYLGDDNPSSTSNHRANALIRIGHEVDIKNPYNCFFNYLTHKFHFHTGYKYFQKYIYNWVIAIIGNNIVYDLIWINGGELFGPKCIQLLRNNGNKIILYNNDDPTGKRDGNRFSSLLKSIRYYDLCVIRKEKKESDFKLYNSNNIFKVLMSYDEIQHSPFENLSEIPHEFISDVSFIGTWIRGEKRDEIIFKLIKNGINVSIWGDRWNKSKYWNFLKPFYRGKSLSGRDYVAAIQGSKISLGFISSLNDDLHTRRSFEIPFSGGLLVAQRTTLHLELYQENTEAFFWDDADECVIVCKKLLTNKVLREKVRLAGMLKVRALKVGNEDLCRNILNIGLFKEKCL